jgi:hypothetical protein
LYTDILKEGKAARRDYWNAKIAHKLGLAVNPTRAKHNVLEIIDL